MSTIAGIALTTGSADGTGSAALFNNPAGIALDSGTNLYIADNGNDTIRKLTPTGSGWTSTTLAGTPGVTGTTNGLGATTLFNNPMGIALDGTGNIYVADSGNNAIRKYLASSGSWTTLAGSIGVSGTGTANGTGTAAKFNDPTALALDAGGNIFVADYNNNAIRKITPAGVVTTFAGADLTTGTLNPSDPKANTQDGFASTALITHPKGVAVDASGNVYASAFSNYSVVKITPSGTNWMLGTIGGTADYNIIYCYLQYWASTAGPGFYSPAGMAVDSYGNLYVADSGANRISIGASLLPPSIGSSLTASGTVGMPFNYTIVAGSMTGPYSNYSVSGLPSGLSVNVATGLISGTPTVTGTFSPIIGAANLAGQTNATLTLAITNLNSYQTWRSQKFTPAQLLDPAICGDMGTPAGDGIFNLMKYALGLNPNTRYASSLVLPYAQVQTVSGTNYLTLAFTQNTAAADVTYSVEASTTLNGTWTEINPLLPANQVSVLPDTPSSGINTITVKDVQPASASTRRFMRLRVTTP